MKSLLKINQPHDFFSDFWYPSPIKKAIDNMLSAEEEEFASFVPSVNISEDSENFMLEFSVPGFQKEDFKIELENNRLEVSGEHKEEKVKETKNYTRKEFSRGTFKRTFVLPEMADTEKMDARYENGILKVHISKKPEAKAKPAKEISIT